MKTRIAFLGLGHMGGPMAANLVKAGYTVIGFDPVAEALEQAERNGVTVAESGAAAAAGAQVVITMLPGGADLLSAYEGRAVAGLISAADPSTLFIDCSTVDVAVSY